MKLPTLILVVVIASLAHSLGGAQERTNYPTVDEPVHYAESYSGQIRYREDQTQAAYLLVLLNLLSPVADVEPDEMAPPDHLERIGLSTALFRLRGMSVERIPYVELLLKHAIRPGDARTFNDVLLEAQRSKAREINTAPAPEAVAELAVISFQHPDPLVRLAAAPLLFVLTDALFPALEELRRGTRDSDDRLALLAKTLLARFSQKDSALDAFGKGRPMDQGEQEPPRTTLVVHGTFANDGTWWRNGYEFFEYLEHDVPITDLFLGDDPFAWSGHWDHDERMEAADELVAWATAHGEVCLNIIAHSHGANVAFIAANRLDYGRMVVLSTPSHRNRYPVDTDSAILSLRVHLDLVVLADGGGNRFPDQANIREEYIGWFNHSATHEEARWISRSVPGILPVRQCP